MRRTKKWIEFEMRSIAGYEQAAQQCERENNIDRIISDRHLLENYEIAASR